MDVDGPFGRVQHSIGISSTCAHERNFEEWQGSTSAQSCDVMRTARQCGTLSYWHLPRCRASPPSAPFRSCDTTSGSASLASCPGRREEFRVRPFAAYCAFFYSKKRRSTLAWPRYGTLESCNPGSLMWLSSHHLPFPILLFYTHSGCCFQQWP